MKLKRSRGQMSVFLCIILIAVIAVTGVLVDGARIAAGEAQVKRAVRSAVKSSLAIYDSRLKNQYGLFALSLNEENELKNIVLSYLKRYLMIEDGNKEGDMSETVFKLIKNNSPKGDLSGDTRHLNLYDFRIENISITPIFSLTENDAVKRQILEYMKYRAPKEIVENIWEKLNGVKKSALMSEAYKRKISADKLLGKLDKRQQKLKGNIDGTGGEDDFFVNKFNRDGSRDSSVNSYAGLFMKHRELTKSLEDLKLKINEIRSGSGGKEDNDTDDIIKGLEIAASEISNTLATVRNELQVLWDKLYWEETLAYIKPNEDAAKNIKEIIQLGEKAEEEVLDLERYLEENFEMSGDSPDVFTTTIQEDLNRLKELILNGKKAQEILGDTLLNRELLTSAAAQMEKVGSMLLSSAQNIISKSEIIDLLNMGLESYNNKIEYDYLKPHKTESREDPRSGVAERVEEALLGGNGKNSDKEDRDIEKAGIAKEELPSHSKARETEQGSGKAVADDSEESNSMEYAGNLNEIDKDIDFKNDEEKFSINAFSFISSLRGGLLKGMQALRDEIYIGEYIMGTFKNSVPILTDDNNAAADLDLRGMDKRERTTFFESEVEYILHGNTSEKTNKMLTRSQILLIRFGLNTIHIYTDAKKKELATGIAAAVAGWWTGGAGIPIISNLIMCSWGMGEAIIDLKDIMKGKKVPFFKSTGDWKLDIGTSSQGSNSDPRLSFDYHDYLRLFLILKAQDKKISRIQDLIELNIRQADKEFRIGSKNTYVRVEAEVSMRYFFISGPFMPVAKKTADGRHKFKVVVYDGY
jgi:hypothetical protein